MNTLSFPQMCFNTGLGIRRWHPVCWATINYNKGDTFFFSFPQDLSVKPSFYKDQRSISTNVSALYSTLQIFRLSFPCPGSYTFPGRLIWAALQQIVRNEITDKMFPILFPILFLHCKLLWIFKAIIPVTFEHLDTGNMLWPVRLLQSLTHYKIRLLSLFQYTKSLYSLLVWRWLQHEACSGETLSE